MLGDGAAEASKSAVLLRRRTSDLSDALADMEASAKTMSGAARVWRALGGFSPSKVGVAAFSEAALRAAFDKIDTDGGGTISASELSAAIKDANPLATDAVVKAMLQFADVDGDGSVDFDEYKAIMRSGADEHEAPAAGAASRSPPAGRKL